MIQYLQQQFNTYKYKQWWQKFIQNKLAVISLVFIAFLFLICFILPFFYPYTYMSVDKGNENIIFSIKHILGTDPLGRDLLIRNVIAARNSLVIALGAVLISLFVGIISGGIAGLKGGLMDLIVMRSADVFFAFPQFLIMVIAVTVLGKGFIPLFLAIGIISWAGYARLIRNLVVQIKQEPFIEAARCLGQSDFNLFYKHILPNIMGPIGVATTLGIPSAMICESGLSLIGLGLSPPMPSWGNLITEGSIQILGYPHLILVPAIFFAITLIAFAYIGDGLQEIFRREQ